VELLRPHDGEAGWSTRCRYVRPFGPARGPITASADFCRPFRPPYERRTPWWTGRQISPGKNIGLRPTSAAFTGKQSHGYRFRPVTRTHRRPPASYAVRVPRIVALPAASFRPHLAVDALAVRLAVSAMWTCRGLEPPNRCPCRARVNNPGLTSGAFNPMQASLVLSLLFLGTSHISLASVRPNLHVLILSCLIEDLGTLFIYGLTSAGLRRYD